MTQPVTPAEPRYGQLVPVSRAWAIQVQTGRSPGYAAMIDLLEREIGLGAADALRAPFSIGTERSLGDLLDGVFATVEVGTPPGTARFGSLEAWMHTDIRGWTL